MTLENKGFLFRADEMIFDHIISLCGWCVVAEQLKRLHLRCESMPFDWLITSNVDKVVEAISSDFKDWMQFDNLIEDGKDWKNRAVIDTKYETVINHFFPLSRSLQESYPEVISKFNRRINRMLNIKNESQGGGHTFYSCKYVNGTSCQTKRGNYAKIRTRGKVAYSKCYS